MVDSQLETVSYHDGQCYTGGVVELEIQTHLTDLRRYSY